MFPAVNYLPAGRIFSFRLLGAFLFYFFSLQVIYGAQYFHFSDGWAAALSYWNILTYPLSLAALRAFFAAMAIASLCLALGKARRLAAAFLFYGMFAMSAINNYAYEAHWPFLGWLLLACALYETDEKTFRWMRTGAWLVLGAAFTASGLSKIYGGSWWQSGEAVSAFLASGQLSPLVAPFASHQIIWKLATWLVLFIELAALPMSLWRPLRLPLVILLFGMHFFIGVFSGLVFRVGFSLGMLVFYAFLFEISWKFNGFMRGRALIKS